MLQPCTKTTTLHKARALANIDGNEQANILAKHGCKLDHRDAHLTPYYLHKDWWHFMQVTSC